MNTIFRVLILFYFIPLIAKAQKLPDVQQVGLWSPNTLRIDGKEPEWNNAFAANNKRTDIFYTICNDDKNIYMAIKSANADIAGKIIAGGISFLVNTKGKKKEEDAYVITYPLIKRGTGTGTNRQNRGNRNEQSQQQRDSVRLVQRKALLTAIKEIKVNGFSQIEDSLISIYNEFGIKAAASFDDKSNIFCEFAIPFAMLSLSYDTAKDFMYQIKLNGRPSANLSTYTMADGGANRGSNGGGRSNRSGSFGSGSGNRGGNGSNNSMELTSATDFWGKYSIYKK